MVELEELKQDKRLRDKQLITLGAVQQRGNIITL